jgi:hypothetical protein
VREVQTDWCWTTYSGSYWENGHVSDGAYIGLFIERRVVCLRTRCYSVVREFEIAVRTGIGCRKSEAVGKHKQTGQD